MPRVNGPENKESLDLLFLDAPKGSEPEKKFTDGLLESMDVHTVERPVTPTETPVNVMGVRPTDEAIATFEEEPDYSISEIVAAGFRRENTIFSTAAAFNVPDTSGLIDETFDKEQAYSFNNIAPSERGRFRGVYNQDDFDIINNRIQRERQDQEIVNSSGWIGGLTVLGAGLTDPINFMPVMGTAFKVGKRGHTIFNASKAVAGAALPAMVTSEAILQATQEERTAAESIMNISGGVILSGVLGAAIGAVAAKGGNAEVERLAKLVEDHFADGDMRGMDRVADHVSEFNDAGSMATPKPHLKGNELLMNKATAALIRTTGKISPAVRAAVSPIKTVSSIVERLVVLPLHRSKNLDDIGSSQSVEASMELHNTRLADSIRNTRELHDTYVKRMKTEGGKPLTKAEFGDQVAGAMRRGDDHALPEVKEAAENIRRTVYEPIKEQLIELKLLAPDADVTTAVSYLNRVYNKKKIIKRDPEFRAKAEAHFDKEIRTAISTASDVLNNAKKGSKAYTEAQELIQLNMTDSMIRSEAKDAANSVINKIIGMDQLERIDTFTPMARGPLKDRTFGIDDLEIEDFLENDIEALLQRFVRITSSEIELKKRFGTVDFKDMKQEILDEVAKLREEMTIKHKQEMAGITDKKARTKATKKFEKDLERLQRDATDGIQDTEAMWDLTRGTYQASLASPDDGWKRGFSALKTLNYTTQLGGVTVSSFSDIGMPVFIHGISRVFGDGLTPLIKSLVSKEAREFIKMSKKTARTSGVALNSELNARSFSNWGIGDPYAAGTGFERFMAGTGKAFGRLTGLNGWNDMMQNFASRISQQRILENVMKKSLSKKESLYMNSIGLGKTQRARIAKELKRLEEDGLSFIDGKRLSREDEWTDAGARDAYLIALNQDVGRTILTKGVGDVPLAAQSDVGKVILQFQNFTMAANQKLLIAGMQRADAEALQGLMTLITAGMMVHYFKSIEQGKELSDDPAEWIKAGVDRSGILGVPMFINDGIMEPMGVGLSNVIGEKNPKYRSRSAAQDLLGPSVRTVSNAFMFGRGLAAMLDSDEKMARGDLTAGRRLIPYQNMVGIRYLFDSAEEGIAKQMGMKTKRKKGRR